MDADPRQAYAETFGAFENDAPGADLPWLRELRREAIVRFQARGFPTLKDEEWKYTNVAPILRTSFHRAEGARNGVSAEDLHRVAFHGFKGIQLVFVNGRYTPRLSEVRPMPEGMEVRSLAEVLQDEPGLVEAHIGKYASFDRQPFAALNTALWDEGALVRIPAGLEVPLPIHLLFATIADGEPMVAHPRNLLLVERGAKVTVVESYVGWGDGAYFTNAVTEAVVREGARLDHYKLQRESEKAYHVATFQVHQERASSVSDNSISFGGALVRNDVNAWFADEGGELALDGLYVLGGRQHVDNHTRIDHAKPNCTSLELYKGILDGHARAIFYGNVTVHKDAQKTNALQTNKNLLLSKDALVDSIPGLQILANDVKCRHGSSIGHMDEDAVFYLRSRGLDDLAARSLLTYGFASEVVNKVRVLPLRAALGAWLVSRLPGAEVIREAL